MQISFIILFMIDLYKDNHVHARVCAFVYFFFKKNFSSETIDWTFDRRSSASSFVYARSQQLCDQFCWNFTERLKYLSKIIFWGRFIEFSLSHFPLMKFEQVTPGR